MKKAFTLIEILVAATIFSIAVLASFSIFFTTSSFQTKTRVTRDITQAGRFFMEAVSREVRMADKIEVLDNRNALKIINYDEENREGYKIYQINSNNDKIIAKVKEPTEQTPGLFQDVTTPDVKVNSLTFKAQGNNGVLIELTIQQTHTLKPGEQGIITLKSVVYKRDY